jgi:hypothetical protein
MGHKDGGGDKPDEEQKDLVNNLDYNIDQFHARKENKNSVIKKRPLQMAGAGASSNVTARIIEL